MEFVSKRFLREEVVRLEYRVKELEDRLCPAEEHDWKLTDSHYDTVAPMDVQRVCNFLCKRCGKRKTERED